MTVKQLIRQLKYLPMDSEVFIYGHIRRTQYLVEEAYRPEYQPSKVFISFKTYIDREHNR